MHRVQSRATARKRCRRSPEMVPVWRRTLDARKTRVVAGWQTRAHACPQARAHSDVIPTAAGRFHPQGTFAPRVNPQEMAHIARAPVLINGGARARWGMHLAATGAEAGGDGFRPTGCRRGAAPLSHPCRGATHRRRGRRADVSGARPAPVPAVARVDGNGTARQVVRPPLLLPSGTPRAGVTPAHA